MGLFVERQFVSASGKALDWKIECDALGDNDWRTLAFIVSQSMAFGRVEGVPTGGLRFAMALQAFANDEGPLLIADDVLTTGMSMETQRAGRPAIGIVAFSRLRSPPSWVRAVWSYGLPLKADWHRLGPIPYDPEFEEKLSRVKHS